jgi:hypothetical protein
MVSRAQELRQQLPAVRAALTGKGNTSQLQSLLADVKVLSDRSQAMEEWTAVVPLLNNVAADTAKSGRDAVQRLANTMKTIVSWQVDGDKLQLKGAITNADSDLRLIYTGLQSGWKACIQGEFSGLADLAQLLQDIQGGARAAEKLRLAAALALAIQGIQVLRSTDRQKLIDAREKRKQALRELHDSGADREVVEFLSAVATRTCTLSVVNNHILTWLKANGQLGKFRVSR